MLDTAWSLLASRRLVATALCLLALVAVGCRGTVGSVGAVLGRDNQTNALYVRDAPPGKAAADAGLLPGDEILMIEGFYVKDLTLTQITALLRGEVGSTVDLTVQRGEAIRQVKVKRTPIELHEKVKPKDKETKG